MGVITDYLRSVIEKQLDQHGVVVWYDPERYYAGVVDALADSETTLARYEGSFYALRYEIDSLLEGLEPPRLLIYVPLRSEDTGHALAEAEAAGEVVKPGQQPPIRNTRPAVIVRNALKDVLGEETATSIEKQVEAGQLSLAEVEALAERGRDLTRGVVNVVFGTGNVQEITLAFLNDEDHDPELHKKNATEELLDLLRVEYEFAPPADVSLPSIRTQLARHLLVSEYLGNLAGKPPQALAGLRLPSKDACRHNCAEAVASWRKRSDLSAGYAAHTTRVERELGLEGMEWTIDVISGSNTFLDLERHLQALTEQDLLEQPDPRHVDLAEQRQSSFWSEHLPEVQARWALVAEAGRLVLEADRIEAALKGAADFGGLLRAYTEGDAPWCLLDTHHRHMEVRYHGFEFDTGESHQNLEHLITKARQRYASASSKLTEAFLKAFQDGGFQAPDTLQQTRIFDQVVNPCVEQQKTAYIWVDALRYEMALELTRSLSDEFTLTLQPAIAAVPTITEIGMAALLPRAHEARIVATGPSKLGIELNGTVIKSRADRLKYLKQATKLNVFDAKLNDLLPNPKRKTRAGIKEADLVVVTSQELDSLGEGGNVLARRIMENVLYELKRACRALFGLGIQSAVLVSDHGHLFGEELSADMKIDPPGGDTADLHRRVWIGQGGAADASILRANLKEFGLQSDFELATPWNLSCFKVQGGANAYFHGGLSPQELIVPVIVLSQEHKSATRMGRIHWMLTPGSEKISTRFFSVQIVGKADDLLALSPPKVRVEVRAKGAPISQPVSASYGFESTGEVQLEFDKEDGRDTRPNTVTLMITEETEAKTASVHLLDAITGAELSQLERIAMAISL